MYWQFGSFYCYIVFPCMVVPQFLYPFLRWRASGWFPVLMTVRMRWQDKDSAEVLRGFIGQSRNRSQAELPSASRGKARICNLREGGWHLYTLADAEVAGPFHIWLESGSRVLIGLFSLVSVFDWLESWRLRVPHSAWQRAVDWWMSVPGTYPGLSGGGFPACGQHDLSVIKNKAINISWVDFCGSVGFCFTGATT